MSFNLLKNIKFNSINRALFNRSYSSATDTAAEHFGPKAFTSSTAVKPELKNSKGLMTHIRNDLVERQNIDGRKILFSQHGKDRMVPGDIVQVEFWRNMLKKSSTSFVGICIGIDRKNIATSITLRNLILKVGVEQKFKVYSPLIKSIKRVKLAEEFRRAKLFYVRDQPKKAKLSRAKGLM